MNFIHQLIQDLTEHELGYVSKRFRAERSNNNLAVIQALRGQKVYDGEILQQKFGWDKPIFNARLNTAYDCTLKVLRELTRDKKITNRIEYKLQDVRILFNRSLYEAALAATQKADRVATKIQPNLPLVETQIWRLKIAFVQSKLGTITKNLKAIETLYQKQNKPIPHNLAYWILFLKMVAIMRLSNNERNNKKNQKQLQQIIEHPLLSNACIPNEPENKALYHYVKSLIEQINGQPLKAIEQAKQMVQTFEDNRLLIEADSAVYVSGLSNICFMFLSLESKQGKAINLYLKKLREAPTTRKDSKKDILRRYYQALLFLSQKNGDYKEVLKIVKDFTKLKSEFDSLILTELFSLIAARVLMYSGAYQQALNYLTPLINKPTKDVDNPTIICNAKILYLACLYSLKQEAFFKSMYSPTRKYLKRKGYWDSGMNLLFDFFKKSLNFKDKQDAQQAEIDLQKAIEIHQKENGITGVLCYFDVALWIEQLLTARTNNQYLFLTSPYDLASHH